MFGFLSRENTQTVSDPEGRDVVGCVGKMPVHADFIKFNMHTRETVSLDNWIQEGVMLMNRKYGDDWKNMLSMLPRYHFVWIGADEDRTMTGVLVAGQDKSGRHYPFAVFDVIDQGFYKDMQAVVPLARKEFYQAVGDVLQRPWNEEGLIPFTRAVDAITSRCTMVDRKDMIDLEMSLLGDITMGEFWSEILPGAKEEIKAKFVKSLMSSLNMVARRTPQRIHWGIRIPLPAHSEALPYVVFWVQLCESILSDRTWHSQYFWNEPAPGFPARLTLFFKPIPPSYFSTLVEQPKNDGSIFDVIQEMQNDSVNIERMRNIVSNDDMLLVDALQQWRSREVFQ